ncbi:uncharacterized protein LOC133868433 [Alnus glutinosa]|uniref:uncharacterized protein LOC133868433 n=1 Tax=Alnus glutinosa TaxID=3517 RepID=UPI002D789447|nr:uncharacterized protein LOC133868433 [Alnus glutinosa]
MFRSCGRRHFGFNLGRGMRKILWILHSLRRKRKLMRKRRAVDGGDLPLEVGVAGIEGAGNDLPAAEPVPAEPVASGDDLSLSAEEVRPIEGAGNDVPAAEPVGELPLEAGVAGIEGAGDDLPIPASSDTATASSDTATASSDTATASSDTATASSDTATASSDTATASSDTATASSDTATASSVTATASSDTATASSDTASDNVSAESGLASDDIGAGSYVASDDIGAGSYALPMEQVSGALSSSDCETFRVTSLDEVKELESKLKDSHKPWKVFFASSLNVEEKDSIVSYCQFENLQYEEIGEANLEENSDAEIKILVEEDESTASN